MIAVGSDGRPELTQVPVLVREERGRLFIEGHIARKSDHCRALEGSGKALVLFTGPHAYVSGSWYSDPWQASTWNYVAVHARGPVRMMTETELIELLRRLSLHFENGDSASTTVYDNLSAGYRDKLVKAIVGFEVEVTELDNVYKLSQNRDEASYDSIVNELKARGGQEEEVGRLMEQRKSTLFPS